MTRKVQVIDISNASSMSRKASNPEIVETENAPDATPAGPKTEV